MKKKIKKVIALFLVSMVAFSSIGCTDVRDEESKNQDQKLLTATQNTIVLKKTSKESTEENEEETIIPEDSYATIVSFGDTLVHSQVYKSAYNSKTKEYDFSHMFKYVKKYFKDATVVVGNSESPMAGADRGYSGYPCFNAPEHLATDLKELGVDILTTANNHCLDKQYSGLSATLDNLDDAGIDHVGTSRSKKEQNKILFKDLNGIKTAFLAYTYGTNGIPVPKGKEYSVNYIDKKLIKKQIKKAKKKGAECIVVSMHWGIEYQTKENSQQDELAEFLIKNDVNIVLGCHPHVLQPMKMVKVKTKTGKTKKGLVIFSQGNFFSSQTKVNTRNTAIFNIKIKKDGETNKVTVEKATYAPVFVYDYRTATKRYRLLDLNGIIKDYENGNKHNWSQSMYQLAKTEKKRCKDVIGSKIDNTK